VAADDNFATVFQAFTATAHRSPDAAFFCVPAYEGRDYHPDGAEFTYDEILTAVLAMKARYEAAGYGHGHRVALLLENRPEFFHHYLALNALGVSIVPVNPDYRQDEMTYQLGHSDAALVIALSNRVADCEAAAADTETRPSVLDAYALPEKLPEPGQVPRDGAPGHDTECALLYTSGTTGRPKGCVLTNLYFLCSGDGYLSMSGTAALEPGKERILNPLPLFHMNALAVTATGAMLSGNCLISPDRFHPTAWWKDIRETGATAFHYLGVVPPMLLNQPEKADDRDHPARVGLGAGVDPKHHENFEKRFGVPLIELWGMTETGKIYGDVEEPRQVGTRGLGGLIRGWRHWSSTMTAARCRAAKRVSCWCEIRPMIRGAVCSANTSRTMRPRRRPGGTVGSIPVILCVKPRTACSTSSTARRTLSAGPARTSRRRRSKASFRRTMMSPKRRSSPCRTTCAKRRFSPVSSPCRERRRTARRPTSS